MSKLVAGALPLLLLLAPYAVGRCTAATSARDGAVADTVAAEQAAPDSVFATLVERLSEPGGFFDTDNLISNEASYLHVLGPMRAMGVTGGAYIGVGPDQNFSYIAQVRPRVAFIIDIRRDNLLQHLMFKALFEMSRTRVEYLAMLHGRPAPRDPGTWRGRDVRDLVAYIDTAPSRPPLADSLRAALLDRVRLFGVPLAAQDLETIGRIHGAFVDQGLDLRFTSFNRPPRAYYPTFRDLVLSRDLTGRDGSYLAREDAFQYVKRLQERDLVIPVVGDLAGPHALAAIGREIAARGERVSAFYASNVEFYLVREGSWPRFATTAAALPRDARSVIIRSYFGGNFGAAHPHAVPGYFSTQTLEPLDDFARAIKPGVSPTYWELVTRNAVSPR
ncbi:MAG: hypothetical protein M3373_04810 [Gemmatimonadota bacterium]|nr:hypothetical protein [Gemmatimonadota bacterium]